MNFDGLKTLGTFSAGAAVVGLMTQQPHYYEAWSGAIFLTVFWRTLARLARNVHNDYQAWRLEQRIQHGVHVDADARTAYRLLVEKRKR